MADRPKIKEDKSVQGIDGEKRAFLRRFVSPFSSMVTGYEPLPNAEVVLKPSAPAERRVIRGDDKAGVFALIGPLARGQQAPGGYRLYNVAIDKESIRYVFEKDGRAVGVTLGPLDGTDGVTFAASASFRITVAADAPEDEVRAVAQRVVAEVTAADRGQLWVVPGGGALAGEAPTTTADAAAPALPDEPAG